MLYKYREYNNLPGDSAKYRAMADNAISYVRQNLDNKEYAFFNKANFCDLAETAQIADNIRDKFSYLVILGMGGSILNPAAILPFSANSTVKIICMDCIDSYLFNKISTEIEIEKTAFLVISKSGDTIETIAMYKTWLAILQQNQLTTQDHFYFIIGKNKSILGDEAIQNNYTLLQHHNDIGGRFASFTNVSILAAMVADIDVKSFLDGAATILDNFISNKNTDVAKSVEYLCYMHDKRKHIAVNITYMNQLVSAVEWYAQIIAESLGKDSSGFTPTKAKGPLDHHSQLQLYVDGSRDKFFTLFFHDDNNYNNMLNIVGGSLNNKNVGDLMKIKFIAFKDIMQTNNLPMREFILTKVHPKNLGALIMHLNLEIIVTGFALGILPFGQPGVEGIKQSTKKLLLV